MNVSVEDSNTREAMVQSLVGGALRKELGIESADLQIGLDVARRHLQRGAAAEAMRVYVALVLCDPMVVDFQVGLANCALQLEENPLALQAASAVIALAPRDSRGYLLSGRACLALGHHAEAEEDLRDAVTFGQAERNAVVVNDARQLLQTLAAINA
ncbi:tetratricopeptide repeat protein [Starkeya sp. ORNL1]|uniref:tetratricopeptide repeat protein n=1 Tax=Starkeya sp. ORNL1 TaxID=2709380 RepID=UPI001462E57C|nr:tetratricopeptide repeat protein [Starkeya sp. ORNL1]QJP15549.1 tetratricopeptide repeat protein [Starkeya sp. ORNL1]